MLPTVSASTVGRRDLNQTGGYTLLESVVILAMLGTLASIMAPSWLGFLDTQRLNDARSEVYQAIRLTQTQAMQDKAEWQFSIRQLDDRPEWAMHPRNLSPLQVSTWHPMNSAVELDLDETTLAKSKGVYYVRFDHDGTVTYRLGRVTFTSPSGGRTKRCVIVSTLLGAMRQGEEHSKPDSSKRYCY